jgi:cation:H+ antiporter
MLTEAVLLAAGIILLVAGSDMLVDAAKGLARAIGVPMTIIGLTVISLGTSVPELVVSVTASIKGASEVALGDITGSNIAGVCLLLGVASLINPVRVTPPVARIDIPVAVVAALIPLVLSIDGSIGRLDGIVLLIAASLYFLNLYRMAHLRGFKGEHRKKPWHMRAISLAMGLIAITLGGKVTLDAALAIADAYHVSPYLIGLTVIAIGTALPELVSSSIASYRRAGDMVMGNSLGSLCFNVLFVLGLSALIHPVAVNSLLDLTVMAVACAMLMPLVMRGFVLDKSEGIFLLGFYALYMTYKVIGVA